MSDYTGKTLIFLGSLFTPLDHFAEFALEPGWAAQLSRIHLFVVLMYAMPELNNRGGMSRILKRFSISNNLCLADTNDAPKPREKIYGLYGILTFLGHLLSDVEYNLPPAERYIQAAKCAIEQGRTFYFIGEDGVVTTDARFTFMGPRLCRKTALPTR
jgi:hypothetical protein